MTVKIKVVRASLLEHPVRNIILIALVGTLILSLVVCESIFGYYYFTYRHKVDEYLQKPLFPQTAMIYAAPKEIRVGQKLTPPTIAQELRAAGYSGDDDREKSRMGTYSFNDSASRSSLGRNPITPNRAPRSRLTKEWSSRSPATKAKTSMLMSWNHSSSPGSPKGRTAPSAAWSALMNCHPTWSMP